MSSIDTISTGNIKIVMFEAWAMCWGRNLEINMVGGGHRGWWLHLPGTGASGAWGVSMSCGVGGRGCLETVPSSAQPSPVPSTTSWLHLHCCCCRPGLLVSLLQAWATLHWSLLQACHNTLRWLLSCSLSLFYGLINLQFHIHLVILIYERVAVERKYKSAY